MVEVRNSEIQSVNDLRLVIVFVIVLNRIGKPMLSYNADIGGISGCLYNADL